jgi:hypothetical protein
MALVGLACLLDGRVKTCLNATGPVVGNSTVGGISCRWRRVFPLSTSWLIDMAIDAIIDLHMVRHAGYQVLSRYSPRRDR